MSALWIFESLGDRILRLVELNRFGSGDANDIYAAAG